jgi:hypothetical protein
MMKNESIFRRSQIEKSTKHNQPEPAASREPITLLADLDKSVVRFVHNSIFQNLNIVNVSDSLKAQKDLEKVITLSHTIKSQTKD